MNTQPFKNGDVIEAKWVAAWNAVQAAIDGDHDDLWNGATECFLLGDVLFVLQRSPFAKIVTQEIFRTSFFELHALLEKPGTFEFYLSVFRAIWGDDVEVEFTVPAPGKLLIGVNALSIQLDIFNAREVIDDAYQFFRMRHDDDGYILFQGTQGIKTQAEVDQLLKELRPAGIWLVGTLEVGGP